jgi:hypothetical protein
LVGNREFGMGFLNGAFKGHGIDKKLGLIFYEFHMDHEVL